MLWAGNVGFDYNMGLEQWPSEGGWFTQRSCYFGEELILTLELDFLYQDKKRDLLRSPQISRRLKTPLWRCSSALHRNQRIFLQTEDKNSFSVTP